MANIFDYLEWRADMPLSVDPFNDVDNLILSELSYAPFDGIVPEDGTEKTLREVRDAFFETHDREALLNARGYTVRAPLLMDNMLTGERFRDMRLSCYRKETDRAQEEQFAAVTFHFPNGGVYTAFRGTDGTLIGWKEDFNFSFLTRTEGQEQAVRYLQEIGSRFTGPIYVGGHSKGGNLAVYASAFCDPALQERILTVYSNDGPGFREEMLEKPGYLRILPKIRKILPDTSIIGRLLFSRTEPVVIKSSASGMQQHDGFSWEVERNHFRGAELSTSGELIGRSFSGWLSQLDDETRRSFFDSVFTVMDATGRDTISGIREQLLRSSGAIFTAFRGLPKEKRQELLSVLQLFGKSGGQTVADYVSDLFNREKEEL